MFASQQNKGSFGYREIIFQPLGVRIRKIFFLSIASRKLEQDFFVSRLLIRIIKRVGVRENVK